MGLRGKRATRPEKLIRMVGIEQNQDGWRVFVANVPESVMVEGLVDNHEPDLKQAAEARVKRELWGER